MEMGVTEILDILPHRYPFLLVDRIVKLEVGKHVIGVKNVTVNEPFFQGHFPGYPVMPGVLIIEAMAQVGAVALLSLDENRGKIGLLAGVDKARFRKQVFPGDQLLIEVEVLKIKGPIGKAQGYVKVNDKIVAEAELMFAIQK